MRYILLIYLSIFSYTYATDFVYSKVQLRGQEAISNSSEILEPQAKKLILTDLLAKIAPLYDKYELAEELFKGNHLGDIIKLQKIVSNNLYERDYLGDFYIVTDTKKLTEKLRQLKITYQEFDTGELQYKHIYGINRLTLPIVALYQDLAEWKTIKDKLEKISSVIDLHINNINSERAILHISYDKNNSTSLLKALMDSGFIINEAEGWDKLMVIKQNDS